MSTMNWNMSSDEWREKIVEILDRLADYYRCKRLSEKTLEVYLKGLRSYSLEVIVHAVDAHLNDPDQGPFFPKIADISRQIGGTRSDKATLAWAKLIAALRRVGAWSSVAFDDPIIHAIIDDIGGWPAVCDWTDEELPFRERDFLRRYSMLLRVTEVPHPPYLKGIHELNNGNNRYSPLRYIGDQARARTIAGGQFKGVGSMIVLGTDRPRRQLQQDTGAEEPGSGDAR